MGNSNFLISICYFTLPPEAHTSSLLKQALKPDWKSGGWWEVNSVDLRSPWLMVRGVPMTDISWELNSARAIVVFLKDPFSGFLPIKQAHTTQSPSHSLSSSLMLGVSNFCICNNPQAEKWSVQGVEDPERSVRLMGGKQRPGWCSPPHIGPALQSPLLPPGLNSHLQGFGWNWCSWRQISTSRGKILQAAIWEVNLSEKESFVKRSSNAKVTFLHACSKSKINKLSITTRQLNNAQIKMETGRMPRNRQLGDANFAIHCILYYFFLITHVRSLSLACHTPSPPMALMDRRRMSWRWDEGQVQCLLLTLWPVFSFAAQGH